MKKSLVFVVSMALFAIAGAPMAEAQTDASNIRAAYVNLQKVLESSPQYKQAQKQLQQFQKNLEQKMSSQREQLDKLRTQMREEAEFLSQKQRQQKRQQLMQKMQAYRQRAQRSQQMVQRKEQQLLAPILERVSKAVSAAGQKHGYNVVYRFNAGRDGNVLWVADSVDLTQKVIEELENIPSDSG